MLGILIDTIDNSELDKLNKICLGSDVVLFTDTTLPPRKLSNLCVFNTERSFDFEGVLVSTSIRTTKALEKNKSAKNKFFYVRNVEWLSSPPGPPYSVFCDAYNNKEIPTIANSPEVSKALSEFFTKPIGTATEWNLSKIKALKNEL